MGYYTYFNGKIDYSDLPKVNQEIIEKMYDTIELMQWGCAARYDTDKEINYYNDVTEWIHYYHGIIDKENKTIEFSSDYKNYYESAQTILYFIAPYLNKDTKYLVEFNGEDDFDYDDEGNEVEPDPNKITVESGKVFVNGELFQTDNIFSFPFPKIRPRHKFL